MNPLRNHFSQCCNHNSALNVHPPESPSIDWAYYKRNVKPERVPLVDEFQKSYQALRIPYPLDNLTELIEKQRKAVEVILFLFNFELVSELSLMFLQAEIREFIKESNARICYYQEQIVRLQNMIPFEQMTIEDFIEAFPNDAPDFHNRPTLWPHTIAEQLTMLESPQHPERRVATVVPKCISCENPPTQQRTDELLWKLG